MRLTLTVLFLIFYVTFSAIPTDIVKNLPQYPADLNFTMYSGLLALPNVTDKAIHYVLITKTGEMSTVNDAPLILWLNGGPGCSSLDGLFIENGPYVLEDGQNELNGTFNIWGWNNFANILYFETPAGVGFSPVGPNGTNWDDPTTTNDAYNALVKFFEGYPEFLNNLFWVAGESYGGIYVPWLGAQIAQQNQVENGLFINLQGIMVGNGVASYTNNEFTEIDFFYGHYLIPDDLYSQIYQYCTQDMSSDNCNNALNQVSELTALINPYDIYRYCYGSDDTDVEARKKGWLFSSYMPHLYQKLKMAGALKKRDGDGGSDVPCLYTRGVNTLLNIQGIKKALNVDVNTEFTFCNITINENYNRNPNGSVPQYQQLMAQNYKILVFSGDTDASVPYTTTLNWIENLNLPVVEDWRPWYFGDQVQGFVEVYNGLTYATVKGVGHQVAAWKRQQGAALIQTFINGQELPRKDSGDGTKKAKKAAVNTAIEL